MKHLSLTLDPEDARPATRDFPADQKVPGGLPEAKEEKSDGDGEGGGEGKGKGRGEENARLMFVGTATVVL